MIGFGKNFPYNPLGIKQISSSESLFEEFWSFGEVAQWAGGTAEERPREEEEREIILFQREAMSPVVSSSRENVNASSVCE